MGRARELSEGPKRRRPDAAGRAVAADWAALAALGRAGQPDLGTFAAILARTEPRSGDARWQAAKARFEELTGGFPLTFTIHE